jgi:hypothetical protein
MALGHWRPFTDEGRDDTWAGVLAKRDEERTKHNLLFEIKY